MAEGASIGLPYLNAYGNVAKVLEKIKSASTPARFTQDFLGTKLGLTGGGATPLIPFLKRTGFLNGDGTPTELYKQFRNEALSGGAAARATKLGYSALYEVNEYVHDLNEKDLMGVIVQVTGLDIKSTTAKAIAASFKALRSFAKFDGSVEEVVQDDDGGNAEKQTEPHTQPIHTRELRLGYTINLNLPATSDIAVFNSIFKSLREHLLD